MTPKLESYKRKLQTSLMARFYLRFHVALILVFSILCGWLCDWLLLRDGIGLIVIRYPLAVLGAYLAFLLAVRIWIEYSGIREYLNQRKSEELVGDQVPEVRDKKSTALPDWLDFGNFGTGDGEGCLVMVVAIIGAVILFYFFGGYLLANAAAFFAEIVVELLLAAGLLRGLNRIESSGWLLGVMNATFWSLIFTLAVAVLFGWWAMIQHPGAITLGQILAK